MTAHRRLAIFGIVVVAVIALLAGLFYFVHQPEASSAVPNSHSQPPATTTAAHNLKQQTLLSADEQLVVNEANQLLIARLRTGTFRGGFQYSHVEDAGGNPTLYVVWYKFTPPTDPGESTEQVVNIYDGTSTDTYQTNVVNVVATFPDCATYPVRCRITISAADALRIARTALPGNWSGGLGANNTSDSYFWGLKTDANILGCHYYMQIDATSGGIISTEHSCDGSPP